MITSFTYLKTWIVLLTFHILYKHFLVFLTINMRVRPNHFVWPWHSPICCFFFKDIFIFHINNYLFSVYCHRPRPRMWRSLMPQRDRLLSASFRIALTCLLLVKNSSFVHCSRKIKSVNKLRFNNALNTQILGIIMYMVKDNGLFYSLTNYTTT